MTRHNKPRADVPPEIRDDARAEPLKDASAEARPVAGADALVAARVRIEPWTDGDLELLWRVNTPEMKAHLGGPETDEQVLARHRKYLNGPVPGGVEAGQMYRIALLPGGEPVGTIGYWERRWEGETVYETGWSVLPEHQGRGLASEAARLVIAAAAGHRRNRYLHAFPSVGNPASNAICRRAGFTFVSECDFEFPPGHHMRCNNWRIDLTAPAPSTPTAPPAPPEPPTAPSPTAH
ncbi:GNAT family N-acetyltransferase [Actinomadura yumaensis]|uniref:GNAT family N-acetyltransferase n=1 Tax=Actinomadura yumaensis TaxID=111807 RepID=A0ABW2CID7_9ACTN